MKDKSEDGRLVHATMQFASMMIRKLLQKKRAGWHGWETRYFEDNLVSNMKAHLDNWECKGTDNLIDIANFCMFLWWIRAGRKENER